MKLIFHKTRQFATLLLLAVTSLASINTLAADITHEVRGGEPGANGYLEMGVGLGFNRVPIVGWSERDSNDSEHGVMGITLHFDGRYQYRGLFAETILDSFTDGTLGFTLADDSSGTHELVLSTQFMPFSPKDYEGFELVETRKGDLTLGLRSQFLLNNYIVQLELAKGVSNAPSGIIASLQLGRQWPVRNWQTHATVGLRYFSDKIVNYYFGVEAPEASEAVAAYSASSATLLSADFGATKPINEKLLLRASLSLDQMSDSIADSPLVRDNLAYGFSVKFIRVF